MRAPTLKALFITSGLLVATAAQAGWQDDASPADASRLAKLDEARSKALDEAAHGRDMAAIRSVLDPAPQSTSHGALTGHWRCRSMKLGGMTPSIVYSWFNCRITSRGDRLYFEKLSGSQRTAGYLYPDADGFVYLGASSMKGEPVHSYSGSGAAAGAQSTPDDQIGRLTLIGSRHARLELPYPVQESTFDVIELKR